ncbi:MAG: hypothetical protein K0U13_04795 [Chlamydiae bacterium]|nr:hypothetical protein [Chlamydiota bacterium]
MKSSAQKVKRFIVENRMNLITYAVAWGVILCSIGFLHGFNQTTVPFSIGMGAGIGLGLLGGGIAACVFHMKNSIGGRMTSKANRHLDFTTRSLALTVFVAVYLVAATRFPHAVGGVTGILIGEHLAIKGYWGKQMVAQARSMDDEITEMKARLQQLERRKKDAEAQAAK